MKILLTHGYVLAEDRKEQKIMRPYPPLGILYLSAYLEKHGISHMVFDTTFSSTKNLLQLIHEEQPNIIAFYVNLMTKINVLSIIRTLNEHGFQEKSRIVLGGPDVTYNQENYLKHGADILVLGEGEETFFELCNSDDLSPASLRKINGLAFMENGRLTRTGVREKISNLDDLPWPNRKNIDLNAYLSVWKKHHGASSVNVSTQRGCPYTCKWCSTAVYGQSYRRRDPGEVVKELRFIRDEYKPDHIWFVDDVFTVSHVWLHKFVEELSKAKVKIAFECITRADRMNKEIVMLLKKAGCFRVWIGAESGSQRVIDAMDRRVSVDQVREMLLAARSAGMETGTFIMLGYPGESKEDIQATVQHLKKSNPDHFTITLAYPIKGTRLYEEVEANMTRPPEWNFSTDRDTDFKRTYSRSFYRHAMRWINAELRIYKKRKIKGFDRVRLLISHFKIIYSKVFMSLSKNG